jgi:thiamine-phosphate pyrophosphorylase
VKAIARFQYLTQDLPGRTHSEQAELACRGGARWVQFRMKNASQKEWKSAALEVKSICRKWDAVFIVNDNPELALEVAAHGVHLGLEDMPALEARCLLGKNRIIGGTANTPDDIRCQQAQQVDYIGIGPFRETRTKKPTAPVLGLQGIRRLALNFPECCLIAIGGIRPEDAPVLMETGIHGIAVSSAVNCAPYPQKAAQTFIGREITS